MFESLSEGIGGAIRRFFGPGKLTEKNIDDGIREVRTALLEADVNFQVVRDFIKRVKERAVGEQVIQNVDPSQQIVKIIHDELTTLLGGEGEEAGQVRFASKAPTVVMMVGLQGSGKTTTTAKLAVHLRRKGRRPMMVAADMQRPAAVEQLKTLGKQNDLPVHAEASGRPPMICKRGVAAALEQGCDVVLLDTAGRLHIDEELMAELREVKRATEPQEIFFVCDAMTGQDAVNSAKEFNEQLEVSGVVLTKLDGDTRGGAAMSIRQVTGKSIRFVGMGEKIGELEPFHPERMASRVLGMGDVVSLVEKAQEVMDEKQAEKDAKKLLKGQFTLDDLYRQLQMMKKIGPMKKIFGMLPGMGQMKEMLDQVDDRHFARMEAIFTSMTPRERQHPDLLDTSRKRRIARGSGNAIESVNDLMKQYRQMQRLMKQLKSGKMPDMKSLMEQAKRGRGGPRGFPGGGGRRGRRF